jgi:arginine deiminase
MFSVTSEVGRLRRVMVHRPGLELERLTPANKDDLLFDEVLWVRRARQEHDAFADALRERDVEVLYLTDLLTETLQSETARDHAISSAMANLHLGDTLRTYLTAALHDQSADELCAFLTAGVRNDEVRGGHGLVTSLLTHDDFLIDPLPNLLFTRDSSVWVHDRVAITSLAMPAQERATMHLDTVCTMVDVDKIVMYPNVADSLMAYAVTLHDRNGEADADLVLQVAEAEPFLVAAAKAMSIDTLHQIDTGLDPVTAEREQWDDGNNTLAISPRVAVAYERNIETNTRLEEAGIEVVAISGSELGSGRGGPRCMSCPVSRQPL